MKKTLLLVTVNCLLFLGCSGDKGNDGPPPTKEVKIPINISASMWTRANDSAFEQNDKIGIYVVNYNGSTAGSLANSGNYVDNMRFTYSGVWTPNTQIYWADQTTKADFYCYYPYSSSIANISANTFSVAANQNSEVNYKASDFMWGKASGVPPTTNVVQITVKHIMSNLLVNLTAGTGFTAAELESAEVTILGLKTFATINLSTGTATATGTTTNIIPKKETDYYRALIVPQSVVNADLIRIVLNGKEYVLKQTITFEANKQHTCTVTIDKTSAGINIGIANWDTDDNNYGGTVE